MTRKNLFLRNKFWIIEKIEVTTSNMKVRLGIKGRMRDLLNPIAVLSSLKIKHKRVIKISRSKMKEAISILPMVEVFKKDILLASEIWRPILNKKIEKLAIEIEMSNFKSLTLLYENLFKSHLMDGAVSHSNDLPFITRISTGTRFYWWKRLIIKQYEHENANMVDVIKQVLYSNNYNYGSPLIGMIDKNPINIECLDEVYFALRIGNILQNKSFDEIVFIGDGAGLLAPLIIAINNYWNTNKTTKYILIDFAHFALATLLRISEKQRNSILVISPSTMCNAGLNETEKNGMHYCKGKRLIINQDSFPEMNPSSLHAYLAPKASTTYVASYNKICLSKGHSDHNKVIEEYKYEQISQTKSKMRSNYSIVFYRNLAEKKSVHKSSVDINRDKKSGIAEKLIQIKTVQEKM